MKQIKNHRIQALMLSKNKKMRIKKYMDVELHPNGTQTYRLTNNKKYSKIPINKYPFKEDYIPFDNWSKYKYILNIEGWVAANRFLRTISLGSLIINIKSNYSLWFEQFAEKNKYYVEINDYSKLEKFFFIIIKIKKSKKYCIKWSEICRKNFIKSFIRLYGIYFK